MESEVLLLDNRKPTHQFSSLIPHSQHPAQILSSLFSHDNKAHFPKQRRAALAEWVWHQNETIKQRSELCDMIKEKTYADSEARKKPKTQKSSNTDNPNEKGRGVIKNPEDSDGSQVFELVPYLIEKMVSTWEKRDKRQTSL